MQNSSHFLQAEGIAGLSVASFARSLSISVQAIAIVRTGLVALALLRPPKY
jgi:hypothetical protein